VTERERRLPTVVVNAMRDAGLYKMFRAKARGGFEVDPVTGFRVIEEVSRIDSAAGWNLGLSIGVDMFGPWFSDSTTEQVFGPEETIYWVDKSCIVPDTDIGRNRLLGSYRYCAITGSFLHRRPTG
jgi:hypothetical protein